MTAPERFADSQIPLAPWLASTAIRAATRPVHPQAQDHLERALGPWIWL